MQMPSMHRYGHPGQNQRRENQSIRNYLSTRSGSRNRISRSPHNMASVYTRAPAIAYDDDTYDTLEESEDNSSREGEYNHASRSSRVRRRHRRSSRRRGPRAGGHGDSFTSITPSGSAEHPISDIDQKRLRKNSDTSSRGTRESPIDDSFGEDNYRLVSRNRATSIYTTPSALYTRTESLKTYKRTTGDSKGTSPALASFLEHKTLSADVINHIPLLRMLESVPRSEAIREDELLYMSAKTFKYVSHWYSNSRPDYANGKMYTSPRLRMLSLGNGPRNRPMLLFSI